MLLLFYIVFTICSHPVCLRWTFANILDTSLLELRTKRGASCGGVIQLEAGGSGSIQLRTELRNDAELYNGDFVEIRELDFVNSKFCGLNPFTYITTGEEIVVQFKSDSSQEDRGFMFIIHSVSVNTGESKCNISIVGGEDSMISNNHAVGASCFYRIEALEDQVIELDLKQLHFGSASCEEESILIYQGLTNQGLPLGKLCSDTINGIQPFHENSLFIEYRNPSGQQGERFLIQYSFVDDTFSTPLTPSTTPLPVGDNTECSGVYKAIDSNTGEMVYTAPEYQNNRECVVIVRNTRLPEHVVQIHFNYFDMQDSDNCTNGSLRILSGERNDSYPMNGPYCGKSLNGRTLITNGNSIRLEFRNDGVKASRGFQAVISFIPNRECRCNGNLKCIRQGFEKRCIQADSCPYNTCFNGGTCLITDSQQTCYCPTGFQGDDCSENNGSIFHDLHFKKAPIDRALKRNGSHFEECLVEVPIPEEVQYHWTLNGVPISEYSNRSGFGTRFGGVLQIDRFNDELAGNYSCVAQTTSGIAEHTFELRLVEDCDVRIKRGPQSEQRKTGEYVMFMCLVDPTPKQIRWKKNDIYIGVSKNPRFRLLAQDQYLRIEKLRMEDAGKYRCEAEDKNGCYSYKEGELTVINIKPYNKYCGRSVHDEQLLAIPKISQGTDALPKANPWHVTLRSLQEEKNISFCGGTLISRRFVLSAAHCISEFEKNTNKPWSMDSVVIILGTTDCLGTNGTHRRPKQYYIHPNYDKRIALDSNIALIELDSAVEYSDSIRPICLEPATYNDRVFLEHRISLSRAFGKVLGCGNSKARLPTYLQELFLPYVTQDQCQDSIENIQELTDDMFCAGFRVPRKGDTCSGDDGGGFVMEASERWVQTGIISHSVGGCDTGRYGIYTKVGNFYTWINDIARFTDEEVPDFPLK